MRVKVREDPPRLSRRWFGDIFFTAWGCLILLHLAMDVFDWERKGLVFWLVHGPLLAIWLAAGVPWLALATRDLVGGRLEFKRYRPFLAVFMAVAVAAFVLQKLVS